MSPAIERLEGRTLLIATPLPAFDAELAHVRRDLAAIQRSMSVDTAAELRALPKTKAAAGERVEATRFLSTAVVRPIHVANGGLNTLARQAAALVAAGRKLGTDAGVTRFVAAIATLRAATATAEDQFDDVIDGEDTEDGIFFSQHTTASAKNSADAESNATESAADATGIDAATNAIVSAYGY